MTGASREFNREFNAASFYEFLKEGRLMGVQCSSCGRLSVQPRPLCPACHSSNLEWYQFSGKARLSTFTCISIVPAAIAEKGYGRDNPYCTGVVTLQEGPRISARISGVDAGNPQNIRTGMDLVVDLEDPEDLEKEKPAPVFKPA